MCVWGVASFINHKTTEGHFVDRLDFKLETHKTVFADQTGDLMHHSCGIEAVDRSPAVVVSLVVWWWRVTRPLTLWPIMCPLSTAAAIHRWTVWSLFHALRALLWPNGHHWYKIISCNLSQCFGSLVSDWSDQDSRCLSAHIYLFTTNPLASTQYCAVFLPSIIISRRLWVAKQFLHHCLFIKRSWFFWCWKLFRQASTRVRLPWFLIVFVS